MTLRFALLGAGRIGKVHARAITANPGARLVAVADAVPRAAADIAGQYGCEVRSIEQILETLAVAAADGQRPLADVLMGEWRRFGRQSGVVVVTSSTDPAWVDVIAKMHASRIHVAAILIDGASFGAAPAIDATIDRLAHAGVPAYLVRQGSDIGAALANVAG